MFQVSCGNRKPKDDRVFKPQEVNEINKIELTPPSQFWSYANLSNIYSVINYCVTVIYL